MLVCHLKPWHVIISVGQWFDHCWSVSLMHHHFCESMFFHSTIPG